MITAYVPRKTEDTLDDKVDFTQYKTGAVRDTGGKGRMDLLPMCALIRVSKHMEDALSHYPERNWEKGLPMHSMIDSAFRHLAKYVDGWTDEDHLCAAATNLLMALWTEEKKPEMQDIPARETVIDENLSPYARRTASLASETPGGTPVPPDSSVQKKAPSVASEETCSYYDHTHRVCKKSPEKDPCPFLGDKEECDDEQP